MSVDALQTSTINEIRSDLTLLHQCISDPHAASVATCVECVENVSRHLVNFFALSTTVSRGGASGGSGWSEAGDNALYEVVTSPTSLLEFVRKGLGEDNMSASSQTAKSIKDAMACLCLVVELAGNHLTSRQCVALKRCAMDAFVHLTRANQFHAIQAEAVRLMTMLVQAAAGHDRLSAAEVGIPRTVEAIEKCLARSSAGQGVRSWSLQLLGALANRYPAESLAFSERMFVSFSGTMRALAMQAEPDHLLGEGVMIGLDLFMESFGSHESVVTPASLQLIYTFVKSALLLADTTPRYQFPKAALRLLKHHALLLRGFLVHEALELFDILRKLCGHKNIEVHKAAYPAASAFLESFALAFCEERPPNATSLTPSANLLVPLLAETKRTLMEREAPYELSFAISAYGALARPISKIMDASAMSNLFFELANKCQQLLNTGEADMEAAARHLPQLVSTFASLILEMPTIVGDKHIDDGGAAYGGGAITTAVDHVHSLMDTVLLLFPKHYYFPKVRKATPAALTKMMFACSKHPLLAHIMTRFVETGVALSMGTSAMYREGAASQAADGLKQPQSDASEEGSLYEEYLPLWISLLTMKQESASSWGYPWSHSVSPGDIACLTASLRRALFSCFARTVRVLDLQCVPTSAASSAPALDCVNAPQAHHSALTTMEGSVTPRSPKDYGLFLCLVPFFVGMAPALYSTEDGEADEDRITLDWTAVMLQGLSDQSMQWPHVSGYYTMTEAILVSAPTQSIVALPATRMTLFHFYEASFGRLSDFAHELLFACASCLLSFPCALISVEKQALPLSIVLRLGMEHEPAASRALNALERFLREEPVACQNTLLPTTLPFLERYASDNLGNTSISNSAAAQPAVDDVRCALVRRVADLIGREGLRVAAALRRTTRLDADGLSAPVVVQLGAASNRYLSRVRLDSDRALQLTLPLRDILVDVPMGVLLPRILELALHASRQPRIAACELLHAVVLWAVGSINLRPQDAAGDPTEVLRVLFPAVVQLAASTDAVASQLFHRLFLQLAHWYAQCPCETAKQAARGTTQYVEAAMDGLSGGSSGGNAAVRTVSAEGICEFMRWSARNVRDHGSDHARLAIRHLAGLYHHPMLHMRLGAAVAFNQTYAVFREMHTSVVSEHVLDLLYHAFSALLLETDEDALGRGASAQLRENIVHIEKILVFHSALCVAPDARRVGQLTTLQDAVVWMFQQCGSTQRLTRSLAMRLFTTLASCLPGFESEDGPLRWLSMTGQSSDIFSSVYDAFTLKDPRRIASDGVQLALPAFLEWAKEMEASIACHLWLLTARYMSPFSAFGRRSRGDGQMSPTKKKRVEGGLAILGGVVAASAERASNLPKSQLLTHLWSFLQSIVKKKVASGVVTDSQCVWLEDDEGDRSANKATRGAADQLPTVNKQDMLAEQRMLAVLEGTASLLECIVDRFPSCLWAESDEEVCEAHSVDPLLHKSLYAVVAQLVLSPQSILGALVHASGELGRIRRVALRLAYVCWSAVSEVCPLERSSFLECFAAAVPSTMKRSSSTELLSEMKRHPQMISFGLRGLRCVQKIGFYSEIMDRVAAAAATAGGRVDRHKDAYDSQRFQDLVAFLREERHVLMNPLVQACFSEYIGMLLDGSSEGGISPRLLLDAIAQDHDDTHNSALTGVTRTSLGGPTEDDFLKRRSTGAIGAMRALQHHQRLWLTMFQSEVEPFLLRHVNGVTEACIALLPDDQRRAVALEVLQLLFTRLGQSQQHQVEGKRPRGYPPLSYWCAFCGAEKKSDPPVHSRVFEDLLAFRLSVVLTILRSETPPTACSSKVSAVDSIFTQIVADLSTALSPTTWGVCTPHQLLHSRQAVQWMVLGCKVAVRLIHHNVSGVDAVGNLLHAVFSGLMLDELPVSWAELKAGSVTYDHYCTIVRLLAETTSVVARAHPLLIFQLLPLLQDRDHPLRKTLIHAVQSALEALSHDQLQAVLQEAFAKQLEALPIVVRQGIAFHIALPCLRRLPSEQSVRIFEQNVGPLFQQAEKIGLGAAATVDVANTQCVTRTCAFVLLTSMFRICSADALKGSINDAFVASCGTPGAGPTTGKELTEKLMRVCISARSFNPIQVGPVDDEASTRLDAALLLQYRQSAYACLVAVVCATQRQEKLFVQFLLKEKNRDLWHQIVDCSVAHAFAIETRFEEVSEQLAAVRTDWELASSHTGTQSAATSSSHESDTGVDVTRRRRGAQRIRYLSSQYLQDSHLGFGFGEAFGEGGSPPTSLLPSDDREAAKEAADEAAVGIASTPLQHRDSIFASMQLELELSRRHRDAADGGLDGLPMQQPRNEFLHTSSSSQWDAQQLTAGDRPALGSALEMDSVWQSCCCNTLVQLLDTLIRRFPTPTLSTVTAAPSQGGGSAATSWVHELIGVFAAPETHLNVKLVIARLITLRPTFFDTYATELFEPLVSIVLTTSIGKGIHYVARDILLLFLQWKTPLPPFHPTSEAIANGLVSHVIKNISHRTRRVIRDNFELFKLLTEKWKGRCHVNKRDLMGWLAYNEASEDARTARMCGVQICGVLAANKIPLYNSRYDAGVIQEDVLMKRLVSNLTFPAREVGVAAAEVIGITLHNLHAQSSAVDDRAALLRNLVLQKLNTLHQVTTDAARFLLLLRRVAEHYADIVDDFIPSKLMAMYHQLTAEDQAVVLELFGMRCERAEQLYPVVHAMVASLGSMRPLLKVALYQLLLLLSPRLSTGLLVNCLSTFVKDSILTSALSEVVDARIAFFKICISVMDQRGSELPEHVRKHVMSLLVVGLEDSSLFVRDMLIRYWDEETRLSLEGAARFNQLFSNMLFASVAAAPHEAVGGDSGDTTPTQAMTNCEHPLGAASWLQHSAILMLSLCHRSPDFARTDALFPQPLKHCHFQPLHLNAEVSSLGSATVLGSSQLTPMFSSQLPVARLARPPSSLGSRGANPRMGDEMAASSGASTSLNNVVLATQENRLFPPTQEGMFTVFERTVSPSSSQSSLMFSYAPPAIAGLTPRTAEYAASQLMPGGVPSASPNGPTSSSVTLRRRFRASADDDAVRQHIVHGTRLRQERDALLAREHQRKAHNVLLFRSYREGEVPDVQISLQAIVVPWQALLFHDQELAKLTMTSIGVSLVCKLRELSASPSAGMRYLPTSAAQQLSAMAQPPAHAATIPSSSAFLVDIPGALNAANARVAADTIQEHVMCAFRHTYHLSPSVIQFCHEILLHMSRLEVASAPSHTTTTTTTVRFSLPPPELIFASALSKQGRADAASVKSALLLLEECVASCNHRSATAHDEVAGLDAEAALRAAWVQYYLALRHHGEAEMAHAAARRFVPQPDRFDAFLTLCSAGDWEGAHAESSKLYDELSVVATAQGAASMSSVAAKAMETTARMVRYEACEALGSLMRWDDVVATYGGDVCNVNTEEALTTRAHEVEQFLRAHLLSKVRGGGGNSVPPPQCVRQLPGGCHALERALYAMRGGAYQEAAAMARGGMLRALTSLSGDEGHSVLALHHLTAVAHSAETLMFMRVKPREALLSLKRQLQDYEASVPSDFSSKAATWDSVLVVAEVVAQQMESCFQSTTRTEVPLEVVGEANHSIQQLYLRGALALSQDVRGVMAAKRLLMRPEARLKGDGMDATAKFRVWAAVLETTMSRVSWFPERIVSAHQDLRQAWGGLLSELRNKRDAVVKHNVVPAGAYAQLEAKLWGSFAAAILKHEGATSANMQELTAMAAKYCEKTDAHTQWLAEGIVVLPSTSGATAVVAAQQEDVHIRLLRLLDAILTAAAFGPTGTVGTPAERQAIALAFTKALFRCIVAYQSTEARAMFPKVLELLEDASMHAVVAPEFTAFALTVSTYAVLPWCAQLISALARRSGATVAPLVRRMVVHHPQLMFYPFHCAKDDILAACNPQETPEVVLNALQFLVSAFAHEPTLASLRTLVAQLGYLHNPELRVRYWLVELRRSFPTVGLGDARTDHPALRYMHKLCVGMFEDCFEADAARGSVNKRFATEYAKVAKKILFGSEHGTPTDIALHCPDARSWKDRVDKLTRELRPLSDTSGLQPLSAFSDAIARLRLGHYGADFIELPQQPFQCLRHRTPQPQPRVIAIDANVLVLSSQQKPKRMKLYTSDEQVHMVLVKGGEDLRLDQRIQQLFFSINGMLANRHGPMSTGGGGGNGFRYPLHIRTYSVVPTSKRVGMVGWVPNTAVLKEIIEGEMRRMSLQGVGISADVAHHPATREYRSLFELPGPQTVSVIDRYLLLYRDAPNTRGQYAQRIGSILQTVYPFYLRDGLRQLAVSAAHHYDLRGRYAASLSALGIGSYLLGIGDRHLENFLVDRETGELVPIDFGHAFGSATTTLAIPELIPFRLSPQMCAALGPLGAEGLVAPMEATLSTICANKAALQTLASTFLKEPLLDWEATSKMTAEQDADAAIGSDVAKAKLESLHCKLALESPTAILERDLEKNVRLRQCGVLADVQRVARGDPTPRHVARGAIGAPAPPLSTRAFVEVLVDLATDLNVLGRTYAGWAPLF